MEDEDPPASGSTADGAEDCGIRLSFVEARVLGCLLEKEATTPDYYPMTLNGLQAACNQKSNREPVTDLDETTVDQAIEGLRDKHLAAKIHLAGSRVPKFKHTIDRVLHLDPPKSAILTVLLLRGVQTAGELNQRTERMHVFGGTPAVEEVLETLIDFPAGALVKRFQAGGGRRVETFGHLLCGEPSMPTAGHAAPVAQILLEEEASWRRKLEEEVSALRAEVESLREDLADLRRQLG